MKYSCKQLIKTWLMLKQTMTWLTWQSWNTHILTKMRNTRNWEHPVKGYFDEDDGTTLDPVQVRAGVEREMAFMGELCVGEPCDRPKKGKVVWSTRWCYRRKGDAVRSRLVVRQFREGTDPSVHAGTSGPAAARILLTLSAIYSLAATADLSVALVH